MRILLNFRYKKLLKIRILGLVVGCLLHRQKVAGSIPAGSIDMRNHLRGHKKENRKQSNSRFFSLVAFVFALVLLAVLLGKAEFQRIPTGEYLDLAKCGNEIIEPEYGEQCEINNDTACPGKCKYDCTCAYCGNNVIDEHEDCDGAFDFECPDQCQSNCKCPPASSRVLTSKYRQSFFYDNIEQDENVTLNYTLTKQPLQSVVLKGRTYLEDVRVYLDANLTNPINAVAPSENIYQYFNVSVQNSSQILLLSAKVFFKVSKTWYSGNNLTINSTILYYYYNSWKGLTTVQAANDTNYTYFSAASPIPTLFAITAEKPPAPVPVFPVCGNGIIESGETETTCCADTGCTLENETCINNRCTFTAHCGNKICEQTEDAKNCPADCSILVLFFPQFMALFVTIALISALSVSYLLIKKHRRKVLKKPKKESAMRSLTSEDEQVAEYIKKHLKKGFSENEIRNKLVHAGWESDFVDEMISESRSKVE